MLQMKPIEEQIGVSKFLVQESSSYKPQYRRSYEARITGNIHDLIAARFRNIKGPVATGALASGVADSFLVPSMQGTPVAMPAMQGQGINTQGNWDMPVYRALLHVSARAETGHYVDFVLTAFSDPVDRSMMGSLNPRMPFYISTVSVLRKFNDRSTGVSVPVTALGSASQLIADNKFAGFNKGHDFRIRPMDVFSYIGHQALDLGTPQSEIYDERTVVTETPIHSEVRNQLPGVFVSKVLGAYAAAHESSGEIGGTGYDKISEAQGVIQEQEAATNMFLRALRNIRGNGFNESVRNYFTLEELQKLSPNEHTLRPRIVPLSRDVIEARAQGPGENWGAAQPLQQMASFIKDAVPALMMENMLMRAHIKVSNMVYATGQPVAQVLDWATFSDVDVTQQILALEQRIVREVFMPLSEQNQRTLDLDLYMFVDSDSRINISVDGHPAVPFVSPTFAGSLLSPVVTSNAQAAFTMAEEFKTLGDMIADAGTQLPTLKGAVYQTGGKKAF
jgi:hypothetical protein